MRALTIALLILAPAILFAQPVKTVYKTIGEKTVYDVASKKAYIVTFGMMIDADGAPRAYHKDNSKALDYLGNAGKPGNWWALVTDNGKPGGNPVVQSADDPAPGYYVSMTALIDPAKDIKNPERYVNSEAVPYIVIPSGFATDFRLGDIALVVNTKNNRQCFAICADIGPKNKIGEGSIFLADQLGVRSNPKKGGTDAGIVYILLKNSGKRKVLTKEEIDAIGNSLLTQEDIAALLK